MATGSESYLVSQFCCIVLVSASYTPHLLEISGGAVFLILCYTIGVSGLTTRYVTAASFYRVLWCAAPYYTGTGGLCGLPPLPLLTQPSAGYFFHSVLHYHYGGAGVYQHDHL